MFIRGRVAVTVDGVVEEAKITPEMDVIFIYPRMPYGVKQQVIGAAAKIVVKQSKKVKRGKPRSNEDANDNTSSEMDIGAYNMALLEHNIIGWQGPSFVDEFGRPLPLTPANIRLLDPKAPLVQRVTQEIGERNAEQEEEKDDETDSPNLQKGAVVVLPAGD